MTDVTRREFVLLAGVLPRSRGLLFPARSSSYGEEFPDMLLSYLSKKLNALSERWDRERSKIKTPEQIEARNRFVRDKFQEMIHAFPERNLLNPVVVNVLERDGYRVENLMFQSRPDFWVTGNLYVPTSGRGPFPGIISPCGHSASARIYSSYQFTYMDLVKNGFVVLAYDPIGQGERRQYWNPQTNVNEIGDPATWEHSMPGQLLLLLGEDLTHYRIWDGMRAIDYLLTRPEVDTERIGCTGQSGGGTLTMFIGALDQRVKCAAIHEGGTGYRWPLDIRPETIIDPPDVEQNLFPAAIYGVDLADLHVAIAPRPLLATIENYSPRFNAAAQRIRARYEQFGVPEKFATEEATDPHAMTMKLRLATTDWFCRWFYNRKGPAREPDLKLEPAENLYCTPNGSVRYSRTGETIFSLILKKQAQLPPQRKVPARPAELESYRREIQTEIKKLLRGEITDQSLGVRLLVTTPRKGYQIEKLEFLSEPGIYVPTWVFLPEGKQGALPAMLFVNEAGKQADGMEFGVLEKLARQGHLVIAVDVRGIGAAKPPHPDAGAGAFRHLDDLETAMSYMTWAMDESLFGMRVQDVVRSVDYVLSRPDTDKTGVRVIGKGMGALWALYAAALDPRIRSVVCEGGLLSYRALTSVDRYLHGADIFIRDVLKHFDLPQVAAAVADRPLMVLSPVDHMKNSVALPVARRVYHWTQQVYTNAGAPDRFRVLSHSPDQAPADWYVA